jgi:8-amino-7-oxononanoate synthase
MGSIKQVADSKLAELQARHLRRTAATTHRRPGAVVERGVQRTISFSCNDYLGLTHHPAVKRAAIAAIETYGVGAGASRLVTGNHPLYAQLEERLARFEDSEAACVFGSGYLANLGTIPTWIGPEDLFLADALSHACVLAGGRQSGATEHLYRHDDIDDCERLLRAHRLAHRRCLIATDSVFSMDGDRARLAELAELARDHDAWLLVDEAHGLGLLTGAEAETAPAIDLRVGTLSKALGSYGGFVAGSKAAVDLLLNRARSLIYSTGLPPASLAAAIAALDVIESDPARRARPVERARQFATALGLRAPTSAIVPLLVGEAVEALSASERLAEAGFLVVAIRPPTVPEGTSRLRFSFSADHSEDDVEALAQAVRSLGYTG